MAKAGWVWTFIFFSAALLLLSPSLVGQEVKFVDATHDLFRPPPWSHQPPVKANFDGRPDPVALARTKSAQQQGTLRTSVTWLDAYEHDLANFAGRKIEFEVRIENIGANTVRVPIAQDLSLLQPHGASAPFGFWGMGVGLMLKANTKAASAAGITLYGSDAEPGTMVYLKPHEWLTVRANDWLRVRTPTPDGDLSKIDAVNARCELESGWFSPETGQLEFTNRRVRNVEGPDVPIRIIDARR